jgi:chromosomal replication initiation ATPase DnaA
MNVLKSAMLRARVTTKSNPNTPQMEAQMAELQAENARLKAKVEELTSAKSEPLSSIIDLVAKEYFVSKIDILSARRTGYLIRPRQVAMYLAKKYAKKFTAMSLPQIGHHFNNRDHSTIQRGVRRIEELRRTDQELDKRVSALEAEIQATMGAHA